jgi:ring-1,2-phenylacetyl-CoA epoxidase subunit PaaD
MVTEEKVWQILEQVSDPEIPVLTIADLGIIRAIKKIDNYLFVFIIHLNINSFC